METLPKSSLAKARSTTHSSKDRRSRCKNLEHFVVRAEQVVQSGGRDRFDGNHTCEIGVCDERSTSAHCDIPLFPEFISKAFADAAKCQGILAEEEELRTGGSLRCEHHLDGSIVDGR